MSETKPEDSGKLYCDILTSKPESLSIDELFKGIVHFLIGIAKREDEYHNEERFFAFRDQLFKRVNVLRNTNADMFAALKEAREALSHPPFVNSPTLKTIDAAIAKAKGETK